MHTDDEPGLWATLREDWRSWNRFDRIAAPLILLVMLATTVHGLWQGS